MITGMDDDRHEAVLRYVDALTWTLSHAEEGTERYPLGVDGQPMYS